MIEVFLVGATLLLSVAIVVAWHRLRGWVRVCVIGVGWSCVALCAVAVYNSFTPLRAVMTLLMPAIGMFVGRVIYDAWTKPK